jgi:hypothetical protein
VQPSWARNVKQMGWSELLRTLGSMPLIYWLLISFGLLLSMLYFAYDCLNRPVCR